jgi:hypothetical protein
MTAKGASVILAQAGCFAGKRHSLYRRQSEVQDRKNAEMREFRKKYPLR